MNEDIDLFSPPNMEAAMAMIADYARINRLSPAALIDIFNTGIAVREIAMGTVGDSKPGTKDTAHA